jgi:gliding motility-associated-like protein
MKILLALLFFIKLIDVQATHIVGGSLTYEHLGGSTFRIKLKLYRDCAPGNSNFNATALISVRSNTAANLGLDVTLPRLGTNVLNPLIDTCAANPGICVEEAIYSGLINLPPLASGYHLIFQVVNRNASLDNVVSPLSTGESLETYIPNLNTLLSNSSPVWSEFPPVFVCAGRDLDFNHAANDADGDSLVYSFYQPWDGVAGMFPTFPGGVAPNNILFTNVPYVAGFTSTNSLNMIPGAPITISSTGVINGIPTALGQYVVGIMCKEYRDGVLIGRIVRDFQFNVVFCPPLKEAGIAPVTGCSTAPIQFTNTSTAGANGFFWDFGTVATTDTTSAANPIFTFPSYGNYTVTLIAQKGTACADTTTLIVPISGVVANFAYSDSICQGMTVTATDNSTYFNGIGASYSWDFGIGGPLQTGVTATSNQYTLPYLDTIVHIVVNSNGCRDTISKPVYVQPQPLAFVGNDTISCYSNPSIQVLGLTVGASGGFWTGSGGSFAPNNTVLNPVYTITPTEFANDSTYVSFTTTGNGFCGSNTDSLKIVFSSGPTALVGADVSVCSDTSSIPFTIVTNFSGGVVWSTVGGTGSFSNPTGINTTYIPTPADTTLGTILIIGTNINNGNCANVSDTLVLTFFPAPIVTITAIDTICSGTPTAVTGYSATGTGVWSTLGDGSFNTTNAFNAIYTHGVNDSINGGVALIFSSTNNGGCGVVTDTLFTVIIPSPQVNFTADSVCLGLNTTFVNGSTSFDPIVSTLWNFPTGLNSPLTNPSLALPNEGANAVQLIVTSSNGCKDSLTKNIIVHYLPNVAFSTPAPCVSNITEFFDGTVVPASTIVAWDWTFATGTSNLQNPLIQFNSTGNTAVQLIATSAYGCIDSLTQTINVYTGPTASFSINPTSAYVSQDVQFTDLSTDAQAIVAWSWNFVDGNTSIVQNPIHQFILGGEFQVILIVTDNVGCTDTAVNSVYIFLPPKVPGAFSPNGDSSNDLLFVYGGPFDELEFKIFNNWGEMIFIGANQSEGWDGKYKGENQPIGVYVYTVKAKTRDGVEHTLKGDFSLIR